MRKTDTPRSAERHLDKEHKRKPHYTLSQLIAECDELAPMPETLKIWMNSPPVRNEPL
jgi:hypothetical protein